jgi:hypothetical protein
MVPLNKKESMYSEVFGSEDEVISLLMVANPLAYQPLIDGMDRIALLVVNTVRPGMEIEHMMWDDAKVQVRRATPMMLERLIMSGENHNVIQWLVQGEIVVDPTHYLRDLSKRLLEWSPLLREQKLLSEFSRFVCTYLQAKQDIREGQVLDAYANVLSSLHYWARILLVEEGMHPELTVWEQMLRVNIGVYKLFEELTTSAETLEQRVQLVLLACEFSVLNKMKSSCSLLIRLVESRTEAWAPAELLRHPSLSGLSLDISVLLHKLVKRGCIREIAVPAQQRVTGLMELRYTSIVS